MSRDELGALLRLLVDTGRLTAAQAAEMVRLFDLGQLTRAMLPVRLADLPARLTPEELAVAMRDVAVRLTPAQATPFLSAAARPVTTSTPPEVKRFLRERLARHFRADYDRTVERYTRALASGGDVAHWHRQMMRENHAYVARMTVAGHGRPLAVTEIDRVSHIAIEQQSYLYKFAAEISARRAIGDPHSEDYLQARIAQYQGAGWQSYWEAAETAETLGRDGYIVHYQAVDGDGRTCGPCLDAQNNGPYRSGTDYPRPAQRCRGRGHCRCTLRFEYDRETWERLAA